MFDFKLWRTSQEVFTGKKPARALRDVLKYDGIYPNIDNVAVTREQSRHGPLHVAAGGDPGRRYYPHRVHPLDAFTKTGRSDTEQKILDSSRGWIKLRQQEPALRAGKSVDLFYDADAYVFARAHEGWSLKVRGGFFEYIDARHSVVVAVNRSDLEKKLTVRINMFADAEKRCASSLVGPTDVIRSIAVVGKTFARLGNSATFCVDGPKGSFEITVPAKA